MAARKLDALLAAQLWLRQLGGPPELAVFSDDRARRERVLQALAKLEAGGAGPNASPTAASSPP